MKDDVEYFLQMLANQTKLARFGAHLKCILTLIYVPMLFMPTINVLLYPRIFVHVFYLIQNRNEIFLKIGIGQQLSELN